MGLKSIILVPTSNSAPPKLMDTRLFDEIIFKAKSVSNIHIKLFYSNGNKHHPLENEMKHTLKHNKLDGGTTKQSLCGYDTDSIVVLWNGDILPCINTTMVVGNILNDGLFGVDLKLHDQCEECPFREVKNDRMLEM